MLNYHPGMDLPTNNHTNSGPQTHETKLWIYKHFGDFLKNTVRHITPFFGRKTHGQKVFRAD